MLIYLLLFSMTIPTFSGSACGCFEITTAAVWPRPRRPPLAPGNKREAAKHVLMRWRRHFFHAVVKNIFLLPPKWQHLARLPSPPRPSHRRGLCSLRQLPLLRVLTVRSFKSSAWLGANSHKSFRNTECGRGCALQSCNACVCMIVCVFRCMCVGKRGTSPRGCFCSRPRI